MIFIILFVYILLLILINNYTKRNLILNDNHSPVVTINILTRSGTRKKCFHNLKKSIYNQTYPFIRHIVSNDNDSIYLDQYNDIVTVHKKDKTQDKKCPYNTYLNDLKNKTVDGWCIILDDDSVLIDNDFIYNLAVICERHTTNDLLIIPSAAGKWSYRMPKHKRVYEYKPGQIDMINIVFHSSASKNIRFTENCAGDWHIYDKFKKAGYNVKYIDDIPIGLWANYEGNRQGKNSDCKPLIL